MRQLTVLCDMDGILVDIFTPWFADYNAEFGDDLTIERVSAWDVHLFAKHGKACYKAIAQPGFFLRGIPLDGALEGLREVIGDGHRVVIGTAATRYAATDKLLWMDRHMPWFDQKNVLIGYPKDLIKANVMIEDGPHNQVDYRRAWFADKPLICSIAYPYNRHTAQFVDLDAHGYRNTREAWWQIVKRIREEARH